MFHIVDDVSADIKFSPQIHVCQSFSSFCCVVLMTCRSCFTLRGENYSLCVYNSIRLLRNDHLLFKSELVCPTDWTLIWALVYVVDLLVVDSTFSDKQLQFYQSRHSCKAHRSNLANGRKTKFSILMSWVLTQVQTEDVWWTSSCSWHANVSVFQSLQDNYVYKDFYQAKLMDFIMQMPLVPLRKPWKATGILSFSISD